MQIIDELVIKLIDVITSCNLRCVGYNVCVKVCVCLQKASSFEDSTFIT